MGQVEIRHVDDFTRGTCEQVHLLKDLSTGTKDELKKGDRALRGLRTGSVVRVNGRKKDNQITVASAGGSIETLSILRQRTQQAPKARS